MASSRRRGQVSFSSTSDGNAENQPLLGRVFFTHEAELQPLYSCVSNPASHLPVYTNIHRIRRDITSVVEDYLSLEQLRDMKINVLVVRPLVDKLYNLDDISIGMISLATLCSSRTAASWACSTLDLILVPTLEPATWGSLMTYLPLPESYTTNLRNSLLPPRQPCAVPTRAVAPKQPPEC